MAKRRLKDVGLPLSLNEHPKTPTPEKEVAGEQKEAEAQSSDTSPQ
jgi:hypothetical protein